MRRLKLALQTVLILFGFLLAVPSISQAAQKQQILVIGRVTDQVRKEDYRITPIVRYLSTKLKNVGVERIEMLFPKHNSQAIQYLQNGKLDIVLETPFSSYAYMQKKIAAPLLLIKREGALEYGTYIFVRKDTHINNLDDLKGKIIAFEDLGSTSAYFLPRIYLRAKGYQLVKMKDASKTPGKNKIGYVFANSELNISRWVYKRKVAAGVLSSLDWMNSKENPAAYRKDFKIIAETQTVPRMVVMVREGLDKNIVKTLKQVLLNMNKTPEGKAALKNFKINGFYPLPANTFTKIEALLKHHNATSN